MTFCVGIRVHEGLVALADTQIVRGQEFSNKAKLSLLEHAGSAIFLMTSGLRSIRDKAVLRLEDELAALPSPHTRLYHVVTDFGDQIKRVRDEDGPSLDSGLRFDSHALTDAAHSRHLACDAGLALDRGRGRPGSTPTAARAIQTFGPTWCRTRSASAACDALSLDSSSHSDHVPRSPRGGLDRATWLRCHDQRVLEHTIGRDEPAMLKER